MTTIQNDFLHVQIAAKGAELQSIYHKQNGFEYLWNGDAQYWNKRSPILFPIVGELKGGTYIYKDRHYRLSRHGFAREKEFTIEQLATDSATFLLQSDAQTHAVYPFDFALRVRYQLENSTLKITYDVENTGDDVMYFSVGGHPAFKVPLAENTNYHDYYLEFDKQEITSRYLIMSNLISDKSAPMDFTNIPLSHELFYKDALVFKHLQANKLWLKSKKTPHGLTVDFSGFPYLGIWSAKDAPFVCIEPWQGIADAVEHDQELVEKEGMVKLEKGDRWEKGWSMDFY